MGDFKKIREKIFKMKFLSSVTVPKNVKFSDILSVAKYRIKRRGDPLVESKKLQKNSHFAEKNLSEKHLDSQSVFSMLWTSVLFRFVLARF